MPGSPPDEAPAVRSAAYQSALGDVLRTLGQAPFDLDAVLGAILGSQPLQVSELMRLES